MESMTGTTDCGSGAHRWTAAFGCGGGWRYSGLPVLTHRELVDWNAEKRVPIVNSNFQGHCRDSVAAFESHDLDRVAGLPDSCTWVRSQREMVHVSFAIDPTGASAPADAPLAPGRREPCNKRRYPDASPCDSRRTHRAVVSARTPEHVRIVTYREMRFRQPLTCAPGARSCAAGTWPTKILVGIWNRVLRNLSPPLHRRSHHGMHRTAEAAINR